MLNIQNHYIIIKVGQKFALIDNLTDKTVAEFESFEGAFSYWIKELKAD